MAKRKRSRACSSSVVNNGAVAAVARPPLAKRKAGRRARKQQRLEMDEESDEEEHEDSVDEDGDAVDKGDIDVDFEFKDPSEEDYHSISGLIKSGTWEFIADLNFAELSDTIANQGNIGTLVTSNSGDEETVCGLLTALNFRQFRQLSWPKQISKALLQKAKKHAEANVANRLEELLTRKGESKREEVGLLLSERFANLPLDLIPPLHKALVDDIEWSCTTPECPADERPYYFFSDFIGVVKCYRKFHSAEQGAEDAARPLVGVKRKKKKRVAAGTAISASGRLAETLEFSQREYEAYVRKASWAFVFPVSEQEQKSNSALAGSSKGKGQEYRAVFAISRQALNEVVLEVGVAIEDDATDDRN